MSDGEGENPNQGGSQIRLEDLEPGALSPSRASAGPARARVAHHVADEAVTARSSGGGASSREGKNAAIDVCALYILRCDKARN